MDHPPKTKFLEQDCLTPTVLHANRAPGLFFAINFIGLG
jgi:hypothetical protein